MASSNKTVATFNPISLIDWNMTETIRSPLFPGPQATSTLLPLLGGCSRYTCPGLRVWL